MHVHSSHQRNVELLTTLATHGEHEAATLSAYRKLILESTDEGVKYLGQLILDEESRHHHVITEMINRIESWDLGVGIEPSTPAIAPRVDLQLLDATRELIKLERQDAKTLTELQHELRGTPPTSLLPLLVSLMVHDRAKHIEILQFIHDYGG